MIEAARERLGVLHDCIPAGAATDAKNVQCRAVLEVRGLMPASAASTSTRRSSLK